ncbi:MAG: cation efflux protein, CzcI family [Roseateles sp.]|uniref:cation efflux protein, CzcI family n=1 Tax=Roseateles sp. TaxID=1971397 RepID=UPI004036ADA6
MRKAVLIFLLAVLPFQFVWGAAAGYCRHEQGSEVSHFGHHLHKHQSKASETSDSSADNAKLFGGEDADCIACHMSCASVVSDARLNLRATEVEHLVATTASAYARMLVPSIDRPKWAAVS